MVMLYKVFYFGAKVNEVQYNQILRIVELRNILDRIKVEWKGGCGIDNLTSNLINNSYKEAFMYFQYLREDHGDEYCYRTIKKSLKILDSIEVRL